MGLARVVTFEGVNQDAMDRMKRDLEAGTAAPEGVPATEIVVLHDAGAEKSLVIVYFDSEDDYARGDELLNAMPAGDTPGQRASVAKYEVAARATG